ncbi:MAG TPA: 2-oxo acid dehydrogenase subunit E2, partial [Gemmatales bacterium]|nr:2-oxo acid dehydrogenase subunit E2 [Gemmatales bacterium]
TPPKAPAPKPTTKHGTAKAAPAAASAPAAAPAAMANHNESRHILAAPATRRLAREQGIDLRQVPGSGPGGRITNEDVLAFVSGGGGRLATLSEDLIEPVRGGGMVAGLQRPDLPNFANFGPVERQAASPIRKRIAQRMVLSQAICATVTHMDEADVTMLEALRRSAKEPAEKRGLKLTLLPIVMKAVAVALKSYPLLNASYDDDRQEIILKRYCHIGVAVDSPQGLLVPVVRDADRRPITELSADIVALAEAARTGKITAEQMRGGSFTITNIGAIGGLGFTPVINWPELAILGLGRLQERPVLDGDELEVRQFLPLCLSFDHRLIDGADAARFTNTIKLYLERPALLLADM